MPRVPTPTMPAATLILARQHAKGLQVYLLKRSAENPFMPGFYVFPGGRVGRHDHDMAFWANHVTPGIGKLVRHLDKGGDGKPVFAYVVAAIRETFEEAGVLLARPAKDAQPALQPMLKMRQPGKHNANWFKNRIAEDGWKLDCTRLAGWAHWITPEVLHPRFDTRFFVAPMPDGQTCRPDQWETTQGLWVTPREGLAANSKGEITLGPPVLVTLHELLPFQELQDLLQTAQRRPWGAPRLPKHFKLTEGELIVEPWDPQYHRRTIGFNDRNMQERVLPVGMSFSKMWRDGKMWLPIR